MNLYVVFARSIHNPLQLHPELLGIFDSEQGAQAFIARAPLPQRKCMEIRSWQMNEPTVDAFWTGDEQAERAYVAEALKGMG